MLLSWKLLHAPLRRVSGPLNARVAMLVAFCLPCDL
jgi:hypothetical protein